MNPWKATFFCLIGTIVLVPLGVISFGRTYTSGQRAGRAELCSEIFGGAGTALQNQRITGEAREYLKAQYYHYAIRRMWQSQSQKFRLVDYGPVDESLLKDLEPFPPHSDSPNEYYHELKKAHAFK